MARITYAAAIMATGLAMAQDTSVTEVPVSRNAITIPQKMLKTYQKYTHVGAVAPQAVVVAAKAPVNATAPASPVLGNLEWLVPVQVGSETLYLDFDTGSSDLWVFSTLMPANQSLNHTVYDPTVSGHLLPNYTWSIGYGDGSGADGIVYKDTVSVGTATVKSQAVEVALDVSEEFIDDPSSGLLGLAMGPLNTVKPVKAATWFNNVKFSLSQRLFTADLRRNAPGTYDFGYIDESKYTSNISYTWINQTQGFWAFEAGPLSFGSNSTAPVGTVIADTGTTLMYLPDYAVSEYWAAQASGHYDDWAGGYIYNCNVTLTDFQITIKDVKYTIPGSYLNAGPAYAESYCFGGLQANDGFPFGILGDVFLNSVFVVFNEVYNPRIGLASKVL